jgi:hypothetical protein
LGKEGKRSGATLACDLGGQGKPWPLFFLRIFKGFLLGLGGGKMEPKKSATIKAWVGVRGIYSIIEEGFMALHLILSLAGTLPGALLFYPLCYFVVRKISDIPKGNWPAFYMFLGVWVPYAALEAIFSHDVISGLGTGTGALWVPIGLSSCSLFIGSRFKDPKFSSSK